MGSNPIVGCFPLLNGEIDIVVRSDSSDPFFSKLAPQIVVECHIHSRQPLLSTEVAAFLSKMAQNGWNAGLLLSLGGFSGEAVSLAASVSSKQRVIAIVGPDEIGEMIESDHRADTIKQILRQSLRRP